MSCGRGVVMPPKRTDLAKYGLTQEEFDELWYSTCGRCPLCAKAFTRDRRRPAAIDHDHKTGETRGLICRQCNVLLGYLHDGIAWMRNAVAYLTNYPVRRVLGGRRFHIDAPPRKESA